MSDRKNPIDFKNIFSQVSHSLSEELVEIFHEGEAKNLRIERIVSRGHHSAPGFWYDQTEYEWVTLLSGSAAIRFKDLDEFRTMKPGDSCLIPPHCKHRIEETSLEEDSIWLAVFWDL